MTAVLPRLRAIAFVVAALAALTGLASRMATSRSDLVAFAGVESLRLSPGQPFGRGAFDGIVSGDVEAVRLRTTLCDKPVYAAPLELKAVALVELADNAYLENPGYEATSVYHGEVRKSFSHLARVLARNPLTPYSIDYFVRFYAPSGCAIGDEAYIEWAQLILTLGTKPLRPNPG